MSDDKDNAFEYILGTLPADEREAFKKALENDASLEKDLNFWEGHLQAMQNPENVLPPKDATWAAIEQATTTGSRSEASPTRSKWFSWLPWSLTAAMTMALALVMTLGQFPIGDENAAPIDYVAVLTDTRGEAKLTAVTEGDSQNMWLQWEEITLESGQDLQIWARSKTDNQIRSIAVIDSADVKSLKLSDAHWRLIKDAATLILTAEEKGGSALDEPSEIVVATGICVRLNRKEKTT